MISCGAIHLRGGGVVLKKGIDFLSLLKKQPDWGVNILSSSLPERKKKPAQERCCFLLGGGGGKSGPEGDSI